MPGPLPPKPTLQTGQKGQLLQERAAVAVGRLDGLSRVLPDADLLLYFYTRREAVLSSQIEGTQSSLSDLLLFEAEPKGPGGPDVLEVSNYVAALRHGMDRMHGGFPLSLRLIREMHELLMRQGRGSEATPGEFRRSQNWIGGSRPGNAVYVPPPVPEMNACLDVFEKFLHRGAHDFSPLVQAALAHAQFETIHPFLDGNGRLGRLLIVLLLVERGTLREPLLYLSLYLKQNRGRYYDHLQNVRTNGAWEEWIEFFMEGVGWTAEGAVTLAERLLSLFARDRGAVQETGRQRGSLVQIFDLLQRRPYLSIQRATVETGLSNPTVASALETLMAMGMVRETTGRQRRRMYAYRAYLDLLEEGTEVSR